MLRHTLLFISLLSLTIQAAPQQAYKPLSLTDALEQGLRKNYQQRVRIFSREILDYQWSDTKEAFWLPTLSLSMLTSEQRIGRLKRGTLDDPGNSRGATGTLSLGFNDYTLFNWGKDYLDYLSNKETYMRSTVRLTEEKRALRNNILLKYFELDYLQAVTTIRKTQLRHASFVYRYSREKVSLRKIGKQEYYQSRSEYLRAQNAHQSAAVALQNAHEEMAFLINDKPGTRYILKHSLRYIPLTIPMDDTIALAVKNNPGILENRKDVNNARRNLERLKLENLPLPKFTVDLGSYTQTFNRTENSTHFQTGSTGNHIDIVASINATWAITGPGGLLNRRTVGVGKYQFDSAQTNFDQARHLSLSNIRRHYYKIKNYERQIKVYEARTTTNSKTFEMTLDNYLARKTPFINYQDTLLEMVESDIAFAALKYAHAEEKINLAYESGVDEFPGESFEQLAKEAVLR